MARNIEVKARLPELQAARRIADEIGGTPQTLHQIDTYFQCTHGRLKLRESQDETQLIRYQRADEPGPRCSRYQLYPLASPEPLKSMLRDSLGVLVVVTKTRYLYFSGSVRIHLDDVEGLGAFLEFEDVLTDDQTEDDQRVQGLLRRFGIEPAQWVDHSYSDLLLNRGNSREFPAPSTALRG